MFAMAERNVVMYLQKLLQYFEAGREVMRTMNLAWIRRQLDAGSRKKCRTKRQRPRIAGAGSEKNQERNRLCRLLQPSRND
jgi:hypothetical protein